MLKLIESAPDAFVVTDLDGLILIGQPCVHRPGAAGHRNAGRAAQSLERWLGRTGVDLNVLITNLRQRGAVRLFATVMRGEYGASTEVEISGVAVDRRRPALPGLHDPRCQPAAGGRGQNHRQRLARCRVRSAR